MEWTRHNWKTRDEHLTLNQSDGWFPFGYCQTADLKFDAPVFQCRICFVVLYFVFVTLQLIKGLANVFGSAVADKLLGGFPGWSSEAGHIICKVLSFPQKEAPDCLACRRAPLDVKSHDSFRSECVTKTCEPDALELTQALYLNL